MKNRFTAKRIALMAIFTALSFVVSLIDFPIFPSANFLKLDFGNVFILLIAFLFGPVEGVIVCLIKEAIHIPMGSTGGVGELANFLTTTAYILLPSVLYRYKKGIKTVLISIAFACVLQTGVALLLNRFLLFPFYFGGVVGKEQFGNLWAFILAFNLIKTVAIGFITLLLYKRLSNVWKKVEQ